MHDHLEMEMAMSINGKKQNMKMYLAICPEEGHLNLKHEIRRGLEKHIDETGCAYCLSFLMWHLSPKYAKCRKKPRMCSCPVAIKIVKTYLQKQRKAQNHLRQAM